MPRLVDTPIEYVVTEKFQPWHSKLVSRLCQLMRGYEIGEFNVKINTTTNRIEIKRIGKADIS